MEFTEFYLFALFALHLIGMLFCASKYIFILGQLINSYFLSFYMTYFGISNYTQRCVTVDDVDRGGLVGGGGVGWVGMEWGVVYFNLKYSGGVIY